MALSDYKSRHLHSFIHGVSSRQPDSFSMATNEDLEKTVPSLSSEGAATLTHDMEQQLTADDATDAKKDMDAKDPDLVDWDGEDDPENPLNWPASKKLPLMFVISFITMLS